MSHHEWQAHESLKESAKENRKWAHEHHAYKQPHRAANIRQALAMVSFTLAVAFAFIYGILQ